MVYKQFCAFHKPIFVVNHTKGMIRLGHWVRESLGSRHLITDNIAYNENKLLRKNVSDSWTIEDEDYDPFFWMHRSMAKKSDIKNLMIYQIRHPFSLQLISSKNIELHIYNNDDSWCSDNLPANCTAKMEQVLISFSKRSDYAYV
jgi:hypothetical protein